MKLAVIGSRNFTSYQLVEKVWFDYFNGKQFDTIVSGGASGADTLAKQLAIKLNLKYMEFLPQWNVFGKQAGFIRNVDIIKNSDFVLAFWVAGSRGTGHSVKLAQEMKKPTLIFYF